MKELKWVLYGFIGMFVLYSMCGDSGDSASQEVTYEEVVLPTEGLITVVKEMQTDLFKIEDEQTIPDTSGSLIIANYLDSTSDTFTLHEARLMQENPSSTTARSSGIMTAASYGFFGYMMGRSMSGGYRPPAGAYVDQKTYDKVSKTTGKSVRNTAVRTRKARPTAGKSGFGKKSGSSGSRSTRSYGG